MKRTRASKGVSGRVAGAIRAATRRLRPHTLLRSRRAAGVIGAATGLIGMAAVWIAAVAVPNAGEVRPWTLPDGFTLERVAGAPQVRYPMFATLDDAGRLYVAESSGGNLYQELRDQSRRCRIVVLEDTTGDGFFDASSTFADDLAFPMGLVWHRGRLYVADPPHVIALEDTTGDGRADVREILLTGFGHQTNGSLHGLTVGPDGWLYMTVGWPDAYRIQRTDGTWLEGTSGAVLRVRLDGSDPEVVALGLENPVELAWTPAGELLATNNWHTEPADGIRDALLHVVEGGVYPRHAWRETDAPLPTTGPWLPAVTLRPAVAHSGMVRYEGTAFPAAQRGLFVAEFNTRSVVRYTLEPEGAGLRADVADFLAHADPAFRPSDVLEADDGSLLVVDTGVWYVQHCPTGHLEEVEATGGIWRVRYDRSSVQDARGEAIPWDTLSAERLLDLLADERPHVRRHAARMLEAGGANAVEVLAGAVSGASPGDVAVRAAWILGRMDEPRAPSALRPAVRASAVSVAAAAARALGGRGDAGAALDLEVLLRHENGRARLAAAEALSRIAPARSVPSLIDALTRSDLGLMEEHVLAFALFRTADLPALRTALAHEHPRVRRTALYLMNHSAPDALPVDVVTELAAAEDGALREAAREILHDRRDWAPHAAELMRQWSRADAPADEQEWLVRYARTFAGHPSVDERTAELVAGAHLSDVDLRRRLINAMASHTADVPDPWVDALSRVMDDDPVLRESAVEAVASLGLTALDDRLISILRDERLETAVRMSALEILADRRPELPTEYADLSLDGLEAQPGPGRMRAARLLAAASLDAPRLARLVAVAERDPAIDPHLVLQAAQASSAPSPGSVLHYLAARVETGWTSEDAALVDLADRADDREAVERLHEALREADGRQSALWSRYEGLLTGGDASRGRVIFFTTAGCASCHPVHGAGETVGPDLSSIGRIRSGPAILQALLSPSSSVSQGYEAWVVETADGGSLIGMLEREAADAVVLRDLSGRTIRLPLTDVAASRPLGRSLMPEGLLGTLSDDDARDLLAYLQSLQ